MTSLLHLLRVAVSCLLALAFLSPLSRSSKADEWIQLEPIAKSIESLTNLTESLVVSCKAQPESVLADRQQIAYDQLVAYQRIVFCFKTAFFAGAEDWELREKFATLEKLSSRTESAINRTNPTGQIRSIMAKMLNERDWLKKQLGFDKPAAQP